MSPLVAFIAELITLLIYSIIVLFVVRSKFWRRVLLISYFTLTLSNIASLITESKFFSIYVYPENLALKDFDITDYAVANMRAEPTVDDRIVLINFGNITRKETGNLINTLAYFKPKVIALDAIYNCRQGLRDSVNCPQLMDTIGNKLLSLAIKNAGHVVVGTVLHQSSDFDNKSSNIADSLEVCDAMFTQYAKQGFTSLPTNADSQKDIKLCRSFWPKVRIKNITELDFAIQVAKQYDSSKTSQFLKRNNEEEIINFRRNIDLEGKDSKYKILDYSDFHSISSTDSIRLSKLLKNRIVILGYLGAAYGEGSPLDEFYTPLNPISAGRSLPDMFGIVLHANVISMVLDEDCINVLPEFMEVLIAFLSCLIHVSILLLLTNKFPKWFEILSVGLILVQLFLYSWLRINLFVFFNLKLNLFLTITSLAIATISISLCRELYHLSYKKLPVWLQHKL